MVQLVLYSEVVRGFHYHVCNVWVTVFHAESRAEGEDLCNKALPSGVQSVHKSCEATEHV